MSEDARVTKTLIQTLEDGKEGFAKGAEKLAAADGGDDIDESGTVAEVQEAHDRVRALRDAHA